MGRTVRVTINGMSEEVPESATIAFLIEQYREMDPALIVEHNGRYVYPRQYGAVTVSQDDRVEFIHADFGG